MGERGKEYYTALKLVPFVSTTSSTCSSALFGCLHLVQVCVTHIRIRKSYPGVLELSALYKEK